MSNDDQALPAEQEGLIVQLLGESKDLFVLISNGFVSKESTYLLRSLFLVLRQMGYFFTENRSSLLSYGTNLTQTEKDILQKIKDIRDAIGHRDSANNFLTAHFKLVGGMNFKDEDAEIQYGPTKLFLVKEIAEIHKILRELFSSASELAFLTRSHGWEIDEQELREAENVLAEKLKDPASLLRRE